MPCRYLKFVDGKNDNDLVYKLKSLGETATALFGDTWALFARSPPPVRSDRAKQASIRQL
jgi:hypothetical protein